MPSRAKDRARAGSLCSIVFVHPPPRRTASLVPGQVWVQGGQAEGTYRATYDRAMDGMVSKLLQSSSPSKLA